jgi:hypothetical protein
VSTRTTPVRYRLALSLVAAAAAAAAVTGATAQAGATPAARGSRTIKSGAGPGWPKTLRPSDFVRRVDNPWFPFEPGNRWHYRGVDEDGHFVDNERVTHRSKKIEGVRVTPVHDVVRKGGKPREITNDFYAQDRHGNIWYFGENTRELDRHGHVTSREGSFRAGRDGARPGVLFPGHPRMGQKARQEYYKGHAEDHFRVLSTNAHVTSPFVSSHHAVRTREWTPLEPNIFENKWYVRGVGDVKEKTVKGPKEKLHLVSFHHG